MGVAGIAMCPTSGLPTFNVNKLNKAGRQRVWTLLCALADCINESFGHDKVTAVLAAVRELPTRC